MDHKWKSSVLRCFDDDEHCDVCRFIAGDRSPEVMEKVIAVLDETLSNSERHERVMQRYIVTVTEDHNKLREQLRSGD